MKIMELIEHPTHIYTEDWSTYAEKLIEQNSDEYYVILYHYNFISPFILKKLLSIYSIAEMFELSDCYLGKKYAIATLWHIVKKPQAEIKISIFFRHAHSEADQLTFDNKLSFPKKYNDDYLEYLNTLEKWMISEEKPADKKGECEFVTIKSPEIDMRRPFPRFYREQNNDIRSLISNSNPNMISLGSIADIYTVHFDMHATKDDIVQVLDFNNQYLRYPFNYEKDTIKYVRTAATKWPIRILSTGTDGLPVIEDNDLSSIIHKGDIIEINRRMYLLNEEPRSSVYAPPQTYIVRLKDNAPVSREYLYLYCNSSTFSRIRRITKMPITNDISDDHSISLCSIEEYPIVLPEKSDDFYQEQFYLLSHPLKRTYSKTAVLQEKSVEDALDNELQNSLSVMQNDLVKREIKEDLQELNTCYKSGAYKASLVMAGSILEAFLIDPRLMDVLKMRLFIGYNAAEIALQMNCSRTRVYQLLEQAKRMARAFLAE